MKYIVLTGAILAITLIAAPFVTYFLLDVDVLCLFGGYCGTKIEQWGTVGDYFGGTLNPILAFLGLVLLLKTIEIQSQELIKSVDALKEQQKQLAFQAFENTFFHLLKLYHENFDRIVQGNGKDDVAVNFKKLYEKLKNDYDSKYEGKEGTQYPRNSEETPEGMLFKKWYLEFKEGHDYYPAQVYFRSIFNTFKFVVEYQFGDNRMMKDNSDEVETRRIKYIKLFRAQLSDYELILIFYNSHYFSLEGRVKFKELIEEYTLFADFPKQKLLDKKHYSFYKESAFK